MAGREDALHAHLRAFAFPLLRTRRGPFRSLTSLPEAEAQAVQASLTGFAAQRSADYLSRRRTLEAEMRILFLQAGGQPQRTTPHYLVIGECPFWQAGITIPQLSACRRIPSIHP